INRDRDRRLLLERMLADALSEPAMLPQGSTPAPTTPATPDAPRKSEAATQLEAARTVLRAAELRLKPEHPDIVRMKRAIRELEKKVEAEPLQVPVSTVAPAAPAAAPPVVDVVRAKKIQGLKDEMEQLDREIARKTELENKLEEQIGAYQRRVEASNGRELD